MLETVPGLCKLRPGLLTQRQLFPGAGHKRGGWGGCEPAVAAPGAAHASSCASGLGSQVRVAVLVLGRRPLEGSGGKVEGRREQALTKPQLVTNM